MTPPTDGIRLGADIGGTFTDVALDPRGTIFSAKVLTTYAAPEQAILDGIAAVTRDAGIAPADIGIVIHRTTLATNALIERRSAKTALVTTEGFRDVIEMRTECRFEQYDLNLRLPTPLIPREHRFAVKGRIGARGQELQPLDEAALEGIAAGGGFGAVAVGFIHSYANPSHERRARKILAGRLKLPISVSAEVSPQMREFERFNTVCANAYVRPQMADYLARLQTRLKDMGAGCPVFMIHSGGGLISVETASEFPVRLVESGPAGGAIFAADIARRFGLGKVVSYDMGGTTAKICLIEDHAPRTARVFEVARTERFCKGSGMPISIPVIEMIEIGAGGGSVASVDAMNRIQTGPESAGSEPGPACYGRGGRRPTITDADLVLGKLDPGNFAGGAIQLGADAAGQAVMRDVGERLSLDTMSAAFGICEVVDENMANAARVHAVENGKDISDNTMIAFGGAALREAWHRTVPRAARRRRGFGHRLPRGPVRLRGAGIQAHPAFRVQRRRGQRPPRRPEGFGGTLRARRHPRQRQLRDHRLHALCRAGLGNPGAAARQALWRRRRRKPVRLVPGELPALLRPRHRRPRRAGDRGRHLVGQGDR